MIEGLDGHGIGLDDWPQCKFCGSYQFVLLGRLGDRKWSRCRACGADQSQELGPDGQEPGEY